MLYLDHAATTPMLPEVWEAMRPFAAENFGNPASAHTAGRKARQALEDARERIANCLGASPDEVIFTSGATEANNLALFGLAGSPPGHILASPIEHPCVMEPLRQLAARGFDVEYLPVDVNGIVSVDKFRECFRSDTRLATVMLVNHETGAVQPIQGFNTQYSILHTDAAQAVGKLPVSFHDLNVTSLSLSAHKFGGPKGVGALVLHKGSKLAPQLFGGHQQHGQRPGTEPVALAVGMAAALEIATACLNDSTETMCRLRDQFLNHLRTACPPVVVNSPAHGSPYIVNVSFPGCRADLLLMKLDLAGIACSTGSACSSGSLLPSPVLQAMEVPDDVLRSAMRFSFGPGTTTELMNEAARRIADCVKRLRPVSAS
ncbi:MAG TPA: cysteine desulfurase family protein [Gemmataceae bacterium]|jgi:cysteine desulfurase|nr:cysteine desulfurase family protein [Gemmataceae bacterium]